MAIKTYLVGLTLAIKVLCRYYVRYESIIIAHINSSGLSSGDKTTVLLFLTTIQASCAIMEGLTGY